MEDCESSFFAPDYVTPGQWRELHQGENGGDAPTKRLMAVLEISLRDATGLRRQYRSSRTKRDRTHPRKIPAPLSSSLEFGIGKGFTITAAQAAARP